MVNPPTPSRRAMAVNPAVVNPPGLTLDNIVDVGLINDVVGLEIMQVGNRLETVSAGNMDHEAVIPVMSLAAQHLARVSNFLVSMYVWVRNMFGSVTERIDDCQVNITSHQRAMEGIIDHAKEEFNRARVEVNSLHALQSQVTQELGN